MKPSHRWRFPRPYGPRKFRFDDGPQEATFGELLAFVMFFLVAFVLIRYFFGVLDVRFMVVVELAPRFLALSYKEPR